MIQLTKDIQTVLENGERIGGIIHGFIFKRLRPIEDKRGDITEMYCPEWGLHLEPMVFAYQVSIRPKAIRSWEMHKKQDDRIFISKGSQRWVLYDNRPESPTYKMVNVFVFNIFLSCIRLKKFMNYLFNYPSCTIGCFTN